jgi:hypothetical protein
VLGVGVEGFRPKQKINICEITKVGKSKGVGKNGQSYSCAKKYLKRSVLKHLMKMKDKSFFWNFGN